MKTKLTHLDKDILLKTASIRITTLERLLEIQEMELKKNNKMNFKNKKLIA
jgi:hypothetical protein